MPFEIHIVVAGDKRRAHTHIAALAAGRQYLLLSAGFRPHVSFEDLDRPDSRRQTGTPQQPAYCAVVRIDA